jgi:hypothetical protein
MIIVTAILDFAGAINLPGWFYVLWIVLDVLFALGGKQ